MNRGSFIKSVLTLIAAPALLADIKPTRPEIRYKVFLCRITKEMQEDLPRMRYILENGTSDFYVQGRAHGINFGKPFELDAGWNEDDFATGAVSIRVKQVA